MFFFQLPVSQLPGALWPSSPGKKLSPYFHWSHRCVSLQGLLPFLCLCLFIACYGSKDCATSTSLPYKLRCSWEGKHSQTVNGRARESGWSQVRAQGGIWVVAEGWGQRESPWVGGTVRAATHLVSIEALCEDEDCCIQDSPLPLPTVLEQILLYSCSSSDNRFCP